MFSTYGGSDPDSKRNDNNDRSDLGDNATLILTSQYVDNSNGNYSFYNSQRNINIETDQLEDFPSSDPSGHEHLMILAAAAANSSPQSDSFKSTSNIIEPARISHFDSSHFSIHDPPLIRLSPTSPNNIFHYNRQNEDVQGLPNDIHNVDHSSNNANCLSHELYVKTENRPDDLLQSRRKRHSFNSSLSDTEYPAAQTRGRANLRHHEPRDNTDQSRNPSTNRNRPFRDLKRKRTIGLRNRFDALVHSHSVHDPVDFTQDLNMGTYIDLSQLEDDNSQMEDHAQPGPDILSPELSQRHFQWWPIKRRCPEPFNVDDLLPDHNGFAISPLDSVTSPGEIASPLIDTSQVSSQYSPLSPPVYVCAAEQSEVTTRDESQAVDIQTATNDTYIDDSAIHGHTQSPPLTSDASHTHTPDYPLSDPRLHSSYLRHVLVPQFCQRHPYSIAHRSASFRDLSRLYLPQSAERHCPYRAVTQSGGLDPGQYGPRRSSFGSLMHAADHDEARVQGLRSSGAPGHDQTFLHHSSSANTIHPTMNTFLRTYELTERPIDLDSLHQPDRDPRLHNDSVRVHPLLRISEHSFLSPSMDRSPGTHGYSRPFALYESQGNVESVIQLALHLETSWRGISAEEFTRLPCHYYGDDAARDGQDKCMVCLDEFLANERLRTLSCGHQYHVACVDTWLKMNRTCPMCRSDAVFGSSNYVLVNDEHRHGRLHTHTHTVTEEGHQ